MAYSLLLINFICTIIPLRLENKEKGLKISLFLLFLFLSFRYDFGEDYMSYYDNFTFMSYNERQNANVEIGYNLLCLLFKPLGFLGFMIFWSAIYCFSLYKTIIRYVSPSFYWLFIFSIISNADLVFVGASAIRQTLAISVILLSLQYLENRKLTWYVILVLLASSFHQSAIIFVLLYPLMNLDINNKWFICLFAIFSFLGMTLLQSQIEQVINVVTIDNFEKYALRYGDSSETLSGGTLGIIIRMSFVLIFLYLMFFEKSKIKSVFYILSVLCVVIFTMRNQVMLQRYTMYFGYMMAISFTYIMQNRHLFRDAYNIIISVVIFWNLNMAYSFALGNNIYKYQTIFSAL